MLCRLPERNLQSLSAEDLSHGLMSSPLLRCCLNDVGVVSSLTGTCATLSPSTCVLYCNMSVSILGKSEQMRRFESHRLR